jgi:hypothetical protein
MVKGREHIVTSENSVKLGNWQCEKVSAADRLVKSASFKEQQFDCLSFSPAFTFFSSWLNIFGNSIALALAGQIFTYIFEKVFPSRRHRLYATRCFAWEAGL